MATIYQPLQIQSGPNAGKWHYTRTDGSGTYAEGYCSPWDSCPECSKDPIKMMDIGCQVDDCEVCHGTRVIRKENPCPGHDTAEEAIEHNRQYEIDHAREFETEDEQRKCKVCGTWTTKGLVSSGGRICGLHEYLCDEHRNRDGLDQATKPEPKSPKPQGWNREGLTYERWEGCPKTLEEALDEIDKNIHPNDRQAVHDENCNDDGQYYKIGGMGMRNNWGLWHDSPLALWFRERGIWHADDMSGVISTAYWRRVHDLSVDDEWIAQQKQYYDDYWTSKNASAETTEQMFERVNGYENDPGKPR